MGDSMSGRRFEHTQSARTTVWKAACQPGAGMSDTHGPECQDELDKSPGCQNCPFSFCLSASFPSLPGLLSSLQRGSLQFSAKAVKVAILWGAGAHFPADGGQSSSHRPGKAAT